MKLIIQLLLAAALCGGLALSAQAQGRAPIMINLTSSENNQANMALSFAAAKLQDGRSLIFYLNEQAVKIAAKQAFNQYRGQQITLARMINKGADIVVCSLCMRRYGLTADDLLPGIKLDTAPSQPYQLVSNSNRALTW